jgi:hypothetical protein
LAHRPRGAAAFLGVEIPTPRWTSYDAEFFGAALPMDVPPGIQDRAYTPRSGTH